MRPRGSGRSGAAVGVASAIGLVVATASLASLVGGRPGPHRDAAAAASLSGDVRRPFAAIIAGARGSAAPGTTAETAARQEANTPYTGRFTFVRIQYTPEVRGFRFFGGREPPWAHDYPRAERNFMRILDELTGLSPYLDGGNIFEADDPELFKFPVAYLCEAGAWNPTAAEVESLRAYLLKGGFIIFDDFRGRDWYNFEEQMRRVLPAAQIVELDVSDPIFHSFFDLESLDFPAPAIYGQRSPPAYYGIFEENDRSKRLLAIINYNNDIGDYWEYSDTDWVPIELSNEAYKLGVNYIVYAMTH